MQDEAPSGLDRAAVMDRGRRRIAGIESQLLHQPAEREPGPDMAKTDAESAIFVVCAHHDDGMVEARIAHARECEKDLTGEELRDCHCQPECLPHPPRTSLVALLLRPYLRGTRPKEIFQ
jgi:hypothetical protein